MPKPGLSKETGYSLDGKQIVLAKKTGRSLKQPRHNSKWWPEEVKIQAAAMWAVCRNDTTTAECCKVPIGRIRAWKDEIWWKNVVQRVIKDKNDELDQKLSEVIHKSTEMLIDRLEHGDIKINFKTNEVIRAPADIKSLLMSVGIIFDKRQLIRGEATSRTESVSSAQKLEELKEAFTKFSKATEIEGVYHAEIQQEESPDAQAGKGPVSEGLVDEVASPESIAFRMLNSTAIRDGGLVSSKAGLQSEDSGSESSSESGTSLFAPELGN